MNDQTYTFKTPNILVRGFMRNGKMCFDSFMRVVAKSTVEAQNKYLEYIRYGKRIGWYKSGN